MRARMAKRWYKNPFKVAVPVLLALGATGACYLFTSRGGAAERAAKVEYNKYSAAEPLSSMPKGGIHPGYVLLTAEQMVKIPLADGFQWPVGTPAMAMMYDAQPFGEPNPKRGGHHSGQDLNGIGGENTDEGEPVYAAARGLVLYSGNPGPGWGNVVTIAHRLPGSNDIIQTLYAHLGERNVRPGQLVGRGQRIGTIGTADGAYLAHLHFEAIRSLSNEAGMPAYHPAGTMNRINPAELIAKHPAPAISDPYEQVRRLMIRETANAAPATTSQISPSQSSSDSIQINPAQFLK